MEDLWAEPSPVADTIAALDLTGRMRRHPYQTLAIAVGVGYILGGGLFTNFTAKVLRVGARVGALPSVQRQLVNVATAAFAARSQE